MQTGQITVTFTTVFTTTISTTETMIITSDNKVSAIFTPFLHSCFYSEVFRYAPLITIPFLTHVILRTRLRAKY